MPELPDPVFGPLADELAQTAASLDVGEPRVERVIARARQRQRRQRTAIGTVSALALVGASVTAVAVLSTPTDRRLVSSSSVDTPSAEVADDGAATIGETELVPSTLQWRTAEPGTSESVVLSAWSTTSAPLRGTGTPYVGYSTLPGRTDNDYQPILWRSDDGLSWQQTPAQPPVGGFAPLLAAQGDRLFTYGTTPTAARAGDVRQSDAAVAISGDDGGSWDTSSLPIDTSALAADQGVQHVGIAPMALAAAPAGVIAVASVYVELDQSNFPADAQQNGWNITEAGLEVYTPDPCVAAVDSSTADSVASAVGCSANITVDRVVPWSELGISAAAAKAAITTDTRWFFSADGGDFRPIDPPADLDPAFSTVRLFSDDAGFLAVIDEYRDDSIATELYRSVDGVTWDDLGPAPISSPWIVTVSGSEVAMAGYLPNDDPNTSRTVISVLRNGVWTTADLGALVEPNDGALPSFQLSALAVGPTGVSALASLTTDPVAERGGVRLAHGDVVLEARDSTGNLYVLDDATGVELGSVEYGVTSGSIRLSETDGSITVVDDVGGVRTRFTAEELNSFYEEAYAVAEPAPTYLLHSADGVSWSRDLLDTLAGGPLAITTDLRLVDDSIVVATHVAGDPTVAATRDTPVPQPILLIATPQG